MISMNRVTPRWTARTALAVLVLWVVSWGISYVDLGTWSLVLALGIAAVKALLVILFFMEIVLEKASIHATLAVGLAMVALLVCFMIADVRTRETPPLRPAESKLSAVTTRTPDR
ncbi:MAG: cytochrome C oxidase subunit IV family protein [Polyangiaceae bacterium]